MGLGQEVRNIACFLSMQYLNFFKERIYIIFVIQTFKFNIHGFSSGEENLCGEQMILDE